MKHTVTIPIRPVAKERPRLGKRGYAYTPKRTYNYEKAIGNAWDGPCFDEPISVEIKLTKTEVTVTVASARGETKLRGDIDNYVKSVLDGLNGIAFTDDSLVLAVKARKS
jgi:crossover junction endodeoxyribonuclease RusA